MVEDADKPEEITWQGKWIVARRRGKWEYVSRAGRIRAAVILPLDGDPSGPARDRHVILVEQYRVPLGARCLELPAGLVGDETGAEGELALDAAQRELEEETGYRADHWEDLGEYQSSPGMTDESFTLLRATGLTLVGEGGGSGSEDIIVHRIALADLPRRIAEFRAQGVRIDMKLLSLLGPWVMGADG